jgi:hypothetical protein
MRQRLCDDAPWRFAEGAVELGAVLITIDGGAAQAITRLMS